MKIALIGSNGLLGSSIKNHLSSLNVDTLLLNHENFEISNAKEFTVIKEYSADVVINTAAYLGVEPCEENPTKAFNINTKAVGDLARFCEKKDITLVQISTDAVFDGRSGNYDENENPKPINLYGITKYSAEQLVANLCSKYYIMRLPILFGKRENKGSIFIEKMYQLYKSGKKELRIADDVISRPSYASDIALRVVDIVLKNRDFGIYHIYNSGDKASLYDFAVEFFNAKKITDISIKRAKADDFSANEKGVKPLNTTLTTIKQEELRDWREAMREYIKEGDI